jgi:phospholipid transport system transporter-binding protein
MSAEAPVTSREAAPAVFRLTAASDTRLTAHGPLIFATARRASEQGEAVLAASPRAEEIDCSGVAPADSAGLAVLISWLGVARRAGRRLRCTHLPAALTALAGISEIEQLLERGV